MEPPEKKPIRRKEDRPGEIVDAALEVFSEVGFANARIADIAKRAGAAKGTVYLYFETKDELFEAVVERFVNPAFSQLEGMVSAFPGSTRQLLSMVIQRAYQELANNDQRRAIFRMLISEGERFPHLTEFYYRQILSGAESMMRGIIQRGVDRGEFRETPTVDFPQVVMGPVMMASLWKMLFEQYRPLDLEKLLEAHLDLIFHGLLKTDTD